MKFWQHVNLVILKNPYLVAPPLVTFLNFHELKLWRIKVIRTFTAYLNQNHTTFELNK